MPNLVLKLKILNCEKNSQIVEIIEKKKNRLMGNFKKFAKWVPICFPTTTKVIYWNLSETHHLLVFLYIPAFQRVLFFILRRLHILNGNESYSMAGVVFVFLVFFSDRF